MTQENKELLLKDLCARLSYGVIVETPKGKAMFMIQILQYSVMNLE